MNQIFLADVIDWVGVAAGVLGAIIVAPSGFSELVRQLLSALRRILPRRPKNITAFAGLAGSSAFSGQAHPHVTMSTDLPEQELLRQLVQRINDLSAQMSKMQQEDDWRNDELRREIQRIEVGRLRSDTEIRKLVTDTEVQNAKFNARGLPLIALGTVMTGPTSILAEWAAVGWIFVALGICSVIYGGWPWLVRLRRRSKHATAVASG